jgi:two-component SAPR family response regulator
LRPEADLWLDVEEFLTLIRQAKDVQLEAPKAAIQHLETALSLYQGEYLPNTRYETWAASTREQISVAYLQAADQLCELYLQDQKPEQAIQLCQKIIAEDNCWERAYRHLMVAYDQLGDHGQVARTFQRCVEVLGQELDISPSPETLTSYHALINQTS